MSQQAPIRQPLVAGEPKSIITSPSWLEFLQELGVGYTGTLTVVTGVSPTTTKTLTIRNGRIISVA